MISFFFIFFLPAGELSFHFLPMTSSTFSLTDKSHPKSALCSDVPLLLGLQSRRQAANEKMVKNPSSASSGSSARSGFYKRLLEWLSRKNKSRRRFSEVASIDASPLKPASSLRNQSAPMIFDVQSHTVPQVVAHPRVEELVQHLSRDEPKDPTTESNWVLETILIYSKQFGHNFGVN